VEERSITGPGSKHEDGEELDRTAKMDRTDWLIVLATLPSSSCGNILLRFSIMTSVS